MKNKKKGFTLVELVIVIAVIAILAAVLIPTFSSVIKNANNSADLQLVNNLNIVASTHSVSGTDNEFETADNIRTMLREEGINPDSLATKNKDVVIVYNTATSKFERCTLEENDLVAFAAEAEDFYVGYYLEEIFENKIIISTRGNAFAEAIFALHNLPSGADNDYVQKAYEKIPSEVRDKVKFILKDTIFINEDGAPVSIKFNGENPEISTTFSGNESRVIFYEKEMTVDASKFVNLSTSLKVVIIPNNITLSNYGDIAIAGNTNGGEHPSIDEARENVAKSDAKKLNPPTEVALTLAETDGALQKWSALQPTLQEKIAAKMNEDADGENQVASTDIKITSMSADGTTACANNDIIAGGTYLLKGKVGGEEISVIIKYQTVQLQNKTNVSSIDYESETWYTIEDALAEAMTGSTVIIAKNTSFASTTIAELANYSGNCYTVKSGVTLLVPYGATIIGSNVSGTKLEDAKDLSNTKTVTTATNAPSRNGGFATLTLLSGVNLTVSGTLTVNAVITATNSASSYVYGANYGEIIVESGAKITFTSASTFNCNGYARGSGKISVESGATVIEPFNLSGFKNVATVQGLSSEMFPVNQFTLASIVCEMTLELGSTYKSGAYIYGASTAYAEEVTLVADKGTPFLKLSSGTLTKSVNEENGKVKFEISGDVSINNISVAIANTSKGQIPLAGHFVIDVKAGITTIPKGVQLKLLPGAEAFVREGATLDVKGAVYSYGQDNVTLPEGYTEYKDGTKTYPVANTANCYRIKPNGLGYDAKTPAVIYVDGTMIFESGSTMGAEISSNGGGTLKIDTNSVKNNIKEDYTDKVTNGTYNVTLKGRGVNNDGSQTPLGNGTWKYENGRWADGYYQIIYNANGGELTGEFSDIYKPGEIEITTSAPTRAYHIFNGWYYSDTEEKVGDVVRSAKAGEVITVYAEWQAIEYTVEFKVAYPSTLNLDELGIPSGVVWSYGNGGVNLNLPQWNITGVDLEFSGWWMYDDYTGEIGSINDNNIDDLTIEGKSIIIYGRFMREGEFGVRFENSAPYTGNEINPSTKKPYTDTERETQHKLNSLYEVDLPANISGYVGDTFDTIGISGASAILNGLDTRVEAYDSHGGNIMEYYFVGWQVKVADDEAEGGYIFVDLSELETTAISKDYLDESNVLVLYAKWAPKTQVYVYCWINSLTSYVSTKLTVSNNKGDYAKTFTVTPTGNSATTNDKHYYYYRPGTEISYELKSNYSSAKTRSVYVKIGDTIINGSTSEKSGTLKGSFEVPEVGTYAEVHCDSQGTSGCLIEGTLVMLADGTTKPVEALTADDVLLTFNHDTGKYEASTLRFLLHTEQVTAELQQVINLQFSDGSVLRIVDEHGLFDRTLSKYVFINDFNYNEFINHEFSSVSVINGEYIDSKVVLESVTLTQELVRIFSPISNYNVNIVAEGMLTVTPSLRVNDFLLNIFDYDDDMKYNDEAKQADIEKYGLFTYEDFEDLLSYDEWLKADHQYLKVAIGKGLITWDDVIQVVEYLRIYGLID